MYIINWLIDRLVFVKVMKNNIRQWRMQAVKYLFFIRQF